MPTLLVHSLTNWQMVSATFMSAYAEIINPQNMTATLLKDGEVLAQYKVERCDHCEQLMRLDEFGYQKHLGGIKILWFCAACR